MNQWRDTEAVRCPQCGKTWGRFSEDIGRITWLIGWRPRGGRITFKRTRRPKLTAVSQVRTDTAYVFRLPMTVDCSCGESTEVDDGYRGR